MPRYEDVANDLRARIHSGEYAIGSTLPQYGELTRTYGVGRGVISSALGVLEREGLIRVVKRTGIKVLDWRVQRRRVQRGQVVWYDPGRGYVFPAAAGADEPWQVHGRPTRSYEPVPERVATLLGMDPGIAVLRRRRITSPLGEPPFQVVDTWISPEGVRDAPAVAEADTGTGGYLDRLEESGHRPLTWVEHTRARMPSREEAALLDISDQTPVLEVMMQSISPVLDRAVEVTVKIIPADRVELVTRLRRHESAERRAADLG